MDEKVITYNDIVRSTTPLDWQRMLEELTWTPDEILSGKKSIIPKWETVEALFGRSS